MVTISILANTVRPYVDPRFDDTAFGAGTFLWQDPVYSWKSGPGEVMTGKFIHSGWTICIHYKSMQEVILQEQLIL